VPPTGTGELPNSGGEGGTHEHRYHTFGKGLGSLTKLKENGEICAPTKG